MAGADVSSRVVSSATHRGWANRILGDAVEGMKMLHHFGRPIAELGRQAAHVIEQARQLEAREEHEPPSQARTA
jgi:hypothetical protein